MIFTTLPYDSALLLALGYLYSLIARYWAKKKVVSQA